MKPKQKVHKTYRVHFVLVHYSSTWGLLFNVVVIPSVTALEKKYLLVFLSHKVSVVANFLLRDRTLYPFHLLLHFGIFFSGLILHRPCACCQSLCVYMYQFICIKRCCFLRNHPPTSIWPIKWFCKHVEEVVEWFLWARFYRLTPKFLRLWRKGLIKTSY